MLENLNWQITLMNSNSLIYPDMFLTLVGSVMSWWNIHSHLWDIHWGCKSTHAIYHIASFLNFFQFFILWLSLRMCMSIMSPTWSIQKGPTTPHLQSFTYNPSPTTLPQPLIYNPSPTTLPQPLIIIQSLTYTLPSTYNHSPELSLLRCMELFSYVIVSLMASCWLQLKYIIWGQLRHLRAVFHWGKMEGERRKYYVTHGGLQNVTNIQWNILCEGEN